MKPAAPALVCCLWLAGCAGMFGSGDTGPSFRDPAMSVEAAAQSIVVGKSTKAEVAAVLGKATVIAFDSGFEVWLYRVQSAGAKNGSAEFVILFSPSGLAVKMRTRPA